MAKNLLIVESPAKARTIKKYLGADFEVKASVGHLVDLPKKSLGVDPEGDFQPEYQVIPGKEKIVRQLKAAAKKADRIYLAPDPDREGEAIAWHIAEQIGGDPEEYHRVLFHELTKKAIQKALAEPSHLDQSRFNSQQARRVLDRLVGYQISPLLWQKVQRGLSAGRVQSVALRLVVERELAIQAFDPQEYWTVTAMVKTGEPHPFEARLAKVAGKKFDPKNQEQAQAGVAAVEHQKLVVTKLTKRERKQRAAPPFITSTLQQEAYRKLGFAPKRTMGLAQRLYEGLKLGKEGETGLITYMRTDSTRLAQEAVTQARQVIAERFGGDYVPAKPNYFKSRGGAQDAHEAIRPTSAARTPESMARFLQKDEAALYRLIWNRFMACQMSPARFDRTQAEITAGQALLRASGQIMTFPGFTAVYVEDLDDNGGAKAGGKPRDALLPPLGEGQELALLSIDPKQHFTQPPPRFTEASLVRELEEKGIGRPSTYATILSTLQSRGYAEKDRRRRLLPTELGRVVSGLLVESFPQIMQVGFTASLEDSLDKVEEGKVDWRRLLTDFYGPFAQALDQARSTMRQVKGKGLPTEEKCPNCGKPMVICLGKNGVFLACSGYPECNTTNDFTRDDKGNLVVAEAPPDPGVKCDLCGEPMAVKKGPYGPFLACTMYPKCKNIKGLDENGQPVEKKPAERIGEKCPRCGAELVLKPIRSGGKFISCEAYPKCRYSRGIPVGVKCPECQEGAMEEKRSRRGKTFYGCSRYPKCSYATWHKPLNEPCPDCGGPFLLEKRTKNGVSIVCPDKDCGYIRQPD